MSIECPHPDEFRVPDGDELRRSRLLAGLDRTDAAQAVGTTRQTLKRYEQGEGSPRLDLVVDLLELYRQELPETRTDGGEVQLIPDPHGIVPDEFVETYDSFRAGERQRSTTDTGDLSRCRECESTNITPKPGNVLADDCSHRKAGSWRCNRCGAHMDRPLPPANEVDETEGEE